MQYWIFKSEPGEYSIDDLKKEHIGVWDGVGNYQARNFIASMASGDKAFFYHSSCKQPGIYGLMSIKDKAYPDLTPRKRVFPWLAIDVVFEEKFTTPLLLPNIKNMPLGECPLTRQGNRLSIIPLSCEQYQLLLKNAHESSQI